MLNFGASKPRVGGGPGPPPGSAPGIVPVIIRCTFPRVCVFVSQYSWGVVL